MKTAIHVAVIILTIYGAYCLIGVAVFGVLAYRAVRRKNRDPYIAWLEDALGRGAVKKYRAPRRQMRAARRELKTITTGMFTTAKEHSDD